MATSLHTFIDIFDASFPGMNEPIRLQKIVIPIIQRDYAQGRKNQDIDRVRNRFLDALLDAVTGNNVTLDFIYGDIDDKGIMTPLDGQQRLTTLFLLHWYAVKKRQLREEEYDFLNRFSYETRYSARDFCSFLVAFKPSFEGKISEEIINQSWFPLDWLQDQTINAMLVMIDSIDEKFNTVNNLWERLKDGAISFYFLPIKDMGLTDDLYIKMNSRGKPLTLFEHFKAELERKLAELDKEIAGRIIGKIDIEWTDMLWRYRGEDNVIDDEFLRYFHFICDILYYKRGDTPQGKSTDEFDLIKEFFCVDSLNAKDNIDLLERYFDCWCGFHNGYTPALFFERFFSKEHEEGKIKIENRYPLDIFEDCLRNNSGITGNGNRAFALNRIVLLYGVITYLLNQDSISPEQFARRIRIVNNLIRNSEDEISDSVARQGGNRMPDILKQVDSIIIDGRIDASIERNFNAVQLAEETEKLAWVEENKAYEAALYALEDHELLYGQTGIVGLEHPEYFERFASLFACDWDKVDCALMAIGNYSQREKNNWRYQVGSGKNIKAWRNLFHRSAASGFDRTKECLAVLLSKAARFDDDMLLDIKNDYIADCEQKNLYEWRYYYVKYSVFRAGRFGKYAWADFADKPYEFGAMWTERNYSQNMYQPFLREIDAQHLSRDDFGMYLLYDDNYVDCANSAFIRYKLNPEGEEEEIDRLDIEQNEDGIDVEDRIQKYFRTYGIVREEKPDTANESLKDIKFYLTVRGSSAVGYEIAGNHFVVMQGSRICPQETPSLADNHRELREQLVDENVIRDNEFIRDYTFSTISAAACVVSGRSANGWIEWRTEEGETYQEVKHRKMPEATNG